MAQHLPPDVLFHIFTSYSSPDQYLNGLMLICRDWYEITNYEMFWLATLKNVMKQQIDECKTHEKFENLIDSTRTNVIKPSDISKERKSYLSSLEKREKILIIDLKPFTKRRETNDDIYGNSYKNKTVQFIRERRKRLVGLELIEPAIEFENDIIDVQLFTNKWEEIINRVDKNQYYDKKLVANLGIFNTSTTIFHTFLKQCQIHFGGSIQLGNEFVDRVISFFIYECGLNISPHADFLIKAKCFKSFLKERVNEETIFEKFRNEINTTGKSGVPSHFLYYLVSCSSLENSLHIELIRKCIEVFKRKKLLKFKENMVEPYLNDYLNVMVPDWKTIELYMKDMNLSECKEFDHHTFLEMFFQKISYNDEDDNSIIIDILQRAHNEFGIKLDGPIPRSLTFRSGKLSILKFLVENGADISSPPKTNLPYSYGVPLARVIYQCYNGSRSDEIFYLIEKGATLPDKDAEMPDQFYESYTYADIFDYYCDSEDKYLPNLKLLFEKFGPRISGVTPLIENIRYSNFARMSVGGFCDILRFYREIEPLNKDSVCIPLSSIYCHWDRYSIESDTHRAEEIREFIEKELGIELDQELIDLWRQEKDAENSDQN